MFTTQPETFFGATFIALNEQHPLAPLAGQLRVRHPLRPGQSLPVVVAPYIVAGYGTSAVMGVPGHDARDLQFAQANGLPVISVVDEAGQKMVNSGPLDGLTVEDARQKMCVLLQQSGTGEAKNTYR